MPNIYYGEQCVSLLPAESVLEALLRSGLKIPHSCRVGACQSCVLRATQPPPPSAQLGLKESQRLQNLFFSCLYRPQEDVTIDADGTPKEQPARLLSREPLGASVIRLRLQTTQSISYFAGQFIQLRREDGLTRSYSLASLPGEDSLELHVRVIPNGQMSQWIANELTPEDPLYLRGPSGDCFYTSGKPEQPLLLLATGTGLAPLYGILRDALQAGHSGPIHLVHGALSRAGLYFEDVLSALATTHKNLSYERCILNGESEPGVSVGDLRALVKARFPALRGFRVFICGDPELTHALKKWAFLAGASMKEILADAFVMSPPPTA